MIEEWVELEEFREFKHQVREREERFRRRVQQVLKAYDVRLKRLEAEVITPPGQATKATLKIGAVMPGQITVDTTNETVTVEFKDDKGDVAAMPVGAQLQFTSDNPSVATVASDANNPLQGDITPVAVGSANIGVTLLDANGQPLLEPDAVTPFAVEPVPVTVSAGEASSADLVLSA